jgi:acetyl/propionyl-CoA carboxylase alpha subunit
MQASHNGIRAFKSKIIQPLETGVVRSILVQDGDHVSAGQEAAVTYSASKSVTILSGTVDGISGSVTANAGITYDSGRP